MLAFFLKLKDWFTIPCDKKAWVLLLSISFVHCAFFRPQNKDIIVNHDLLEKKLLKEINTYRKDYNKPPIVWNQELSQIAYLYSQKMSEENFFSHIDLEGRRVAKRLGYYGISFVSAGENLAKIKGSFDPARLVNAWHKSISHKENIQNPHFTSTGIGIYQSLRKEKDKTYSIFFITQILIQPFKNGR